MSHIEHKSHAKKAVKCAVLTISDSRTEKTDESGGIITSKLEESMHKVAHYKILKDDYDAVKNEIESLLNSDADVIITNGGTGISTRDITYDVVEGILDKKLHGFGELFRYLSYNEIGSAAIMSRAVAGVAKGKVVISVPGSKNAVKLAMEKLILPELGHMVFEANR
ncbi:MAG: molybdenum cofactor biosynthesis protein [Candidatus Altiarchaeales archaeon WOR_SM1_79]|nr:MAG: molybdenum cofactor biosynthesis protein [Candidatus Altiarchaeales archaeon WOR_SM1_79]